MADEKLYTFTIGADAVDADGKEMFESTVKYQNMKYADVVLVEGALIKMLEGLNKYASENVSKKA